MTPIRKLTLTKLALGSFRILVVDAETGTDGDIAFVVVQTVKERLQLQLRQRHLPLDGLADLQRRTSRPLNKAS